MSVVHVPVMIPGWIKVDLSGEEPFALHVEIAPDESEFRKTGVAFFEEEEDEPGRNLATMEAEAVVAALSNDSFREISSAGIYT